MFSLVTVLKYFVVSDLATGTDLVASALSRAGTADGIRGKGDDGVWVWWVWGKVGGGLRRKGVVDVSGLSGVGMACDWEHDV